MMNLFLIAVGLFVFQSISGSSALWRGFKEGDYIVGALFPVSRGPNCTILNEESVVLVEAFIFAVNRVNADPTLLPNTTLGYEILDTCSHTSVVRKQVLYLMKRTRFTNCSVKRIKKAVVGVIGPAYPHTTLMSAGLLNLHRVPQISYTSSSSLDNKLASDTFFRTGPSQRKRIQALVDVISRFNWSCVNIMHSRDSYIRDTAVDLSIELSARNVCVALSSGDPLQALSSLSLRSSVTVLMGDLHFVAAVFLEARKQNVTTHTWIVYEATGVERSPGNYSDVMCGMLGLCVDNVDGLAAFKSHLRSVGNVSSWYNAGIRLGNQVQTRCRKRHRKTVYRKDIAVQPMRQWTDYAPYVIDAVLALGHALHEVIDCRSCGPISQRLVSSLKEISFSSVRNKTVWFDRNGDLSSEFVVVNAQKYASGALQVVSVGKWIEQRDERAKLTFNAETIRWSGNEERAPISRCAQPCSTEASTKYGPEECRGVCHPCARGTYRAAHPASHCKRCPAEQMTNKNQTSCVKKPLDIIRVTDKLSISLLSLCGLGELVTLIVLCVFLKFHSSHVVKASNIFFSVFTLLVLLVWFASPVLGVGPPTDLICRLRMAAFPLLYTTVSAALFTKTTRVVRIFRAIKGTRFLSNVWYSILTCALIFVQATLCAVHWVFFPPHVQYDYESEDITVPMCRQNSVLKFSSLGYNTLISVLCACSAFSSRGLPGRYNEAKWICLAMFTSVLSWATHLIAHLFMTEGHMKTAVQILSVTAGAYAVLIFLFFPKIRVIFLQPEKNTVQAAVASARRFSFEVATKKNLPLYDNFSRRHTSPDCLKLGPVVSTTRVVYKISSVHIPLYSIKDEETHT